MSHLFVRVKLLELTSLIQLATIVQIIQFFTALVAFSSYKQRRHLETQEALLMLMDQLLDMGSTIEWVAMVQRLQILEARWF